MKTNTSSFLGHPYLRKNSHTAHSKRFALLSALWDLLHLYFSIPSTCGDAECDNGFNLLFVFPPFSVSGASGRKKNGSPLERLRSQIPVMVGKDQPPWNSKFLRRAIVWIIEFKFSSLTFIHPFTFAWSTTTPHQLERWPTLRD